VLIVSLAAATSSRDPRGIYSAPANGRPLCALKLHITGFRNDNGTAGALVFASSGGWPDDVAKAIVHGGVPIRDHQAEIKFEVPAGRYAAAVIHDENSNMKLDRNVFGIPKEGFGFSDNPQVVFSAPAFRKAAAPVTCPATRLDIRLIYK
jgi:uncharacterized protein (DUF2141 family)